MVADSSVDFAFSFDSLVYVEAEVLKGYLTELARVLKPDGVAFLHHSNLGAYQRSNHALAPFRVPSTTWRPSRGISGLRETVPVRRGPRKIQMRARLSFDCGPAWCASASTGVSTGGRRVCPLLALPICAKTQECAAWVRSSLTGQVGSSSLTASRS